MSNAHLLQRNRYYESLRGIGCPHHLAQSIVDTYIHAYECASSEIAENTRLTAEIADAKEALRLGQIGGIYDDFHSLADAIGQMTTYIKGRERRGAQLEDDIAAIAARRCETCAHGGPDVAAGHYLCWMHRPALQTRYNHSCPHYDPKEAADADHS